MTMATKLRAFAGGKTEEKNGGANYGTLLGYTGCRLLVPCFISCTNKLYQKAYAFRFFRRFHLYMDSTNICSKHF
jgi:hypothetical protein